MSGLPLLKRLPNGGMREIDFNCRWKKSKKIDIKSQQGEIEIVDLHMVNPRKTKNGKYTEYTFRFECQEGEISLNATGFKMHVRKKPILQQGQSLDILERGGVNFEKGSNAL